MGNKVWRKVNVFVGALSDAGFWAASLALVAMTLLITTEVILRSYFYTSTLLADEYGGYLCVALAFFGGAYALKEDAFIRVDMLYNRYSPKFKKTMDIMLISLGIVYMIVLAFFITRTTLQSFTSGAVSTYVSQTPIFIPQISMVIGSYCMILQLIVQLGNKIMEPIDLERDVSE